MSIIVHHESQQVSKVMRPGRITYPFAYMTNVYTRSDRRGAGIGSELLKQVNEWAKEQQYEFIIVWPSDTSISYYEKNDYAPCTEPMQYVPSP
ncbi:GNAT family N-acetyltransferase [Priestia koreensis]|uniref:GNAT family N-acetyltransferase n=1 Tax=Priestia koreensis TaxID=284581 RepID=UPI001F56F410|nr:GNAT family N-acetyltransferase [Priestia koreensis]